MAEQALAQWIAVDAIDESPFNPRRTFTDGPMKTLEESIRVHGVKQPILVRPKGDRYELVFGARRLRASKNVSLEKIPAMVEGLADDEVLELQVIENRDREDIHPLDDAQHYRRLHEQHGRSVDELVARLGVSRGTVYARLKMAALDSKAAETFRDAETPASIILEVARIHDPKAQREAAKEVVEPDYHGDRMSVREARDQIRSHYHLRLAGAGFPLEDAELLSKAGSCVDCPKRSGNQAELFADVSGKGSADVCTDRVCFQAKREAWAIRQVAEAQASGANVLEGKAAAKIFRAPYYGEKRHRVNSADFVDLNDACDRDPKRRSYRRLLPAKKRPPVTVAVDPDGNVHDLIRRADLAKALREAGHNFRQERTTDPGASRAAAHRKKAQAENFLRDRVVAEIGGRGATVGALLKGGGTLAHDFWQILAETLVENIWSDLQKSIATRRLETGEKRARAPRDDLSGWVRGKRTTEELQGVVLELIACTGGRYSRNRATHLQRVAKITGVEVGKVQRAARADLERLAKPRARRKTGAKPRTRKKTPARATKKKGTRKKKTARRSAKR